MFFARQGDRGAVEASSPAAARMARHSDRFIGCRVIVGFPCPIEGEVEIGWRLAHKHWGQGYALEAAQASLDHGFGPLGLSRITSFTVPRNTRSWGLMERLGMERREDLDFEHPDLAPGHPLRPHIVYVKTA